ncbi:MAG: VOC family protein [Micrococcales bacterium]|nr:VOC family protein [Micrococcales bacterium]
MAAHETTWPEGTPCWADVQANDLEAMADFYNRLLGWQIDGNPDFPGYLIASVGGRPVAGIGAKPENLASVPSAWSTYLAVEHADQVAARIEEHGGELMMGEPFDVAGMGRMTFVLDAAGCAVGIWQAGEHIGFGVTGVPGSVCWNELHTTRFAEAIPFYESVFGVTATPMSDTDDFRYSTLDVAGHTVGGIFDDPAVPEGTNGYWLLYFAVSDVDGVVDAAAGLGATVLMPPQDSPYGRMAVIAGLEGELFAVIEPTLPA